MNYHLFDNIMNSITTTLLFNGSKININQKTKNRNAYFKIFNLLEKHSLLKITSKKLLKKRNFELEATRVPFCDPIDGCNDGLGCWDGDLCEL